MTVKNHFLLFLILLLTLNTACNKSVKSEIPQISEYTIKAQQTLDSLYKYYGIENNNLLRETYPFDESYKATYLDSGSDQTQPNAYSYLWPFSGTLSAVNTLTNGIDSAKYNAVLVDKVLPGLENYYDTKREPAAYSSYINTAPESDRFYDDNVWLGIDFTDMYLQTKDSKYLDKAKEIWKFIESGTDNKLGGGIYWCEQNKGSKNTCSNAPGAVYAFKLFEATSDSTYFTQGLNLYEWTKSHLQDSIDFLYYDNINLEGKIGEAKFPYNSGQMLQAAALLYKLTKDQRYLDDAQAIAKSGYNYFFTDFTTPSGESFKILKNSDVWFIAVMFRGYVELYTIDGNDTYMEAFKNSLDYAWNHTRDDNGLFNVDWTGEKKDQKKWLLTQGAFVELLGRLGNYK